MYALLPREPTLLEILTDLNDLLRCVCVLASIQQQHQSLADNKQRGAVVQPAQLAANMLSELYVRVRVYFI